MKCSICSGIPSYICPCANILLCSTDLEVHCKAYSNHCPSALQPLSNDQSLNLKLQLIKRIELIDKAKSKIIQDTKSTIKVLTNISKSALSQLENVSSQCLSFLDSKIIFTVNKDEINKILETSFEIPAIESLLVEKIKELLGDNDILKSKDLNAWSQERKLDYVKKKMNYTKLVSDNIKFSSDDKYAFNCKIYVGKSEKGMDK